MQNDERVQDDEQALKELNVKIGDAENRGDHGWLADVVGRRRYRAAAKWYGLTGRS